MAQEIKKNIDYKQGLDLILTCIANKYHLQRRFNVGKCIDREDVFLINSLNKMYCKELEGVDEIIKKLNLKYGNL